MARPQVGEIPAGGAAAGVVPAGEALAGGVPAAGNCSTPYAAAAGGTGGGGGTGSGGGSGVYLTCADETGLVANGVTYGTACIHNPPCGKRMALVPEPEPCPRQREQRLKQRRRS